MWEKLIGHKLDSKSDTRIEISLRKRHGSLQFCFFSSTVTDSFSIGQYNFLNPVLTQAFNHYRINQLEKYMKYIVCRKIIISAIFVSILILPAFSRNDDYVRFQGYLSVTMAPNSTTLTLDEITIKNDSEKTATDISITHEETSGIKITIDPAHIPVLPPGEQIKLSISISNTLSIWSKSMRVEPDIYMFLNGNKTDQTSIRIRIDPPSFPWIVTILGLCVALLGLFILIYFKFSKQETRRKYD